MCLVFFLLLLSLEWNGFFHEKRHILFKKKKSKKKIEGKIFNECVWCMKLREKLLSPLLVLVYICGFREKLSVFQSFLFGHHSFGSLNFLYSIQKRISNVYLFGFSFALFTLIARIKVVNGYCSRLSNILCTLTLTHTTNYKLYMAFLKEIRI